VDEAEILTCSFMFLVELMLAAEMLMSAKDRLSLLYACYFRLLSAFFFPPTKMSSSDTNFLHVFHASNTDPRATVPVKKKRKDTLALVHAHALGRQTGSY
jgi:hypothetical protein